MRFAVASLIILFITAGGPVYAVGFGGYFSAGGGSTYWNTGGYDNRSRDTCIGGGVFFDTAIALDRLFNYRVSLSMDSVTGKYTEGDLTVTEKGNIRGSLVNTFGFGFYRTSRLRIWAGPQVGFHIRYREASSLRDAALLYYYGFYNPYYTYTAGFSGGSENQYSGVVDFGLALGGNFHITDNLSFLLTGGARYAVHFAIKNIQGDTTGQGYEGFVNIGFTFNLRDTYHTRISDGVRRMKIRGEDLGEDEDKISE